MAPVFLLIDNDTADTYNDQFRGAFTAFITIDIQGVSKKACPLELV